MILKFLQVNITDLFSQKYRLYVLVGTLCLSNIILGIAVLGKSERTYFIPPKVNKAFWVQGGEVSESYLKEVGYYLTKLLLDLTPESFHYNHELLLTYATPQGYGSLKSQLMKDGEQYASLQLSTHFNPSQIIAHPQTLEVEVKGTLTSYVADKLVKSTLETIKLKFAQGWQGLLLESVSGGNPHAS